MSLGAVLRSSLLATLAHPIAWPVALAGFLVRGGIVVFLLPIVALPSPVGISDRIAPTLSAMVLGGATMQLAILFGSMCALVVAIVLLLAWFAAATEASLIRDAPAWDELDPARPIPSQRRGGSGRILTARLAAHIPFAITLVWGGVRIVEAAYRELSRPVDTTTPIALRALGSVPEVIVVAIVTWIVGQILGAMAARRIILLGTSSLGGLRAAHRGVPAPADPGAPVVPRPCAGPGRGAAPDGGGDIEHLGSGTDRDRRTGRSRRRDPDGLCVRRPVAGRPRARLDGVCLACRGVDARRRTEDVRGNRTGPSG